MNDINAFVCSLSADERDDLLADIQADTDDDLANITEEDFDVYMADMDAHVEAILQRLGESGECAYRIYFNTTLYILWYEEYQ